MPSSTATVSQLLDAAADRLKTISDTPRLDAELLLEAATGLRRVQVRAHPERQLNPEQTAALEALLTRRCQGEPVAYILGHWGFWSLDLTITPAVLIPRPETELLVELALTRIPNDATWRIADLGTGSGALALAIASERPHCRVLAVDASAEALAVAEANGRTLGLTNVEFRHSEWFQDLTGERFELVVANPPYVATDDPHLRQGDVAFEPRSALVAGSDGLDDIRHLTAAAPAHLAAKGWLLLEHGWDQGRAVRRLLTAAGFTEVASHCDLGGRERATVGRRP